MDAVFPKGIIKSICVRTGLVFAWISVPNRYPTAASSSAPSQLDNNTVPQLVNTPSELVQQMTSNINASPAISDWKTPSLGGKNNKYLSYNTLLSIWMFLFQEEVFISLFELFILVPLTTPRSTPYSLKSKLNQPKMLTFKWIKNFNYSMK